MESIRILVVEDDAIIGKYIQTTLETLGYQVLGLIATGEGAVAAAFERQPDLILMDVVLRDEVDGIAAAERIRQRLDIPIIYLTAYSDTDTVERAGITGPFGYLLKPFDDRSLHLTIQMAFHKHALDKRLKASEERYRLITENADDTIWLMDLNLQTTFISPSVERASGFTQEELYGMSLGQQVAPASLQVALEVIAKELTPERLAQKDLPIATTLELELYRKDGSTLWVEANVRLVRDNDGKPVGLLGVARDITRRRQAEKELQARQQFLILLHEITRAALESENLSSMLQVLADHLGALIDANHCYITLWDDARQVAIPTAASQPVRKTYPCERLEPGERSLTAAVLQSGFPIIEENVLEARYISPRIARKFPSRSVIGLPLIADHKKLGAMIIGFTEPHHFTPEEIGTRTGCQ
jgi:PAS domain S-box-containing protein